MLVLFNMEMKHFAVNINYFLHLTLPFVIAGVESRNRAKDAGQLKETGMQGSHPESRLASFSSYIYSQQMPPYISFACSPGLG